MFKSLTRLICHMPFLWASFLILVIAGCSSNSGGSNVGGSSSLTLDQVSTVPLINGQSQTFYVYATNNSTSTMSNIQWTIDSQEAAPSTSIIQQAKLKLKNVLHTSNSESQAIIIKDTSECVNVAANQSCRVQLQANNPGVFQLHATSGSQKITLLGGAGIIQSEVYTPVNTGDLADILSLTPINEISYSNGVGSSNFFIINNGESSVQLDIEALKANFPANVSLVLGNCPNPLPNATSCQVRIIVTNPTNSTDQELDIPIVLSGEVINSDNSRTVLPKQNGDGDLKATTKLRGIIQYPTTQTVLIDNSYANVTTSSVSGMISNSGSGILTIHSLVPNGEILSISSDNCSGKTLGQGDVCSYTVNLAVAKIINSNSELINITYIDEAGSDIKSATSTVNWTYIAPLAIANPSISMSVSNSNLTQINTTSTLTITNNGNVALSNLSTPTIGSANSHITLTSVTCTGNLAVNASCYYTVTYNPAAPSENASVIFDGVSGTSSDNRGGSITTVFTNSTSVNVASIFEGLVTSDTVLALNESTSSGTVTFKNMGNHIATISGVAFTSDSTNLIIINDGCNGKSLAVNQNCEVEVKLSSTATSGSGHGNLDLVYDNHNGTALATTSNSNISWLIGMAPSLQVTFANTSLATPVNIESSTIVTLTNNGRDDLTNIVIPVLPPIMIKVPFQMPVGNMSYGPGLVNGCKIDGTQALAIGETCTLTFRFNVSMVALPSFNQTLAAFSASYDNNGTRTAYTTGTYQLNLTILAWGDLSFNPVSVTQSVNWVNKTQTSNVVIANIGGIPITLGAITSSQNEITTNGCSGVLQPTESCVLSVIGSYESSASTKVVNGVLTVPYTATTGSHSETLNITANYQAMPVVTPGLTVVSTSLIGQNIVLGTNESHSYAVTLTNTTSATNNGVESIVIAARSLMPESDGNTTYSIDTDGITTNPCTLPTGNQTMRLVSGTSCNYHLVVKTGSSEVTNSVKRWSIGYGYSNYVAESLTPRTSSTQPVSKSFTLTTVTPVAQLSVAVATGENNNFNGIERGVMPYPTLGLIVKNTGNGAVNGTVTASLPNGITGSFTDCDNLGAGESCTPTLTMSTNINITQANLSSINLNYNNRQTATTASFPSVVYSVKSPSFPVLSMVESVIGCVKGDGTTSACMNNPDSKGGTASAMKVRLTITNNSSTASATNVGLQNTESALFVSAGYIMSSNTCAAGVAANGGTCVIEYSMPITAATQEIQPDITYDSVWVNCAYTTAQGQNLTMSAGVGALNIDIDVVNPVLTIGSIESITQGESKVIIITASDVYQSSMPTVTLSVESPASGSAVGITTTSVTCDSLVSNGTICNGSIITSASTPALMGYKAIANASSINIQSNTVLFNVNLITFTTAYIVNTSDTTISKCSMTESGIFSSCASTGSGFDGPYGIAVNTNGTYAYVTNSANNTVSKCSIDIDDSLSNCTSTGSGFDNPLGIALNSNGEYAYITNSKGVNSAIIKCTINLNGDLSSCASTGGSFVDSEGIALNGSGTMTYTTNYSTSLVTKCDIDLNGSLSGCASSGSGFVGPSAVALNNDSTYAYITNGDNNSVSKCSIGLDGGLSNCTSTGGVFNFPMGVTLNPSGTMAYVVNMGDNTITKCNISINGDFSNCANAGGVFSSPIALTFK